jgi:hypothetical protein
MKNTASILITILLLFTASAVRADTIELADGTLLEGDFIGSSNGIIMFNTGSSIEAFPEDKVVGIFLSSGVATAEKERAKSSPSVTVPAGTRLVIRTSDTVDTSRHAAGHRFRGQLESALVVGGNTVVPRGAYVHGRITGANQSRGIAGDTNLSMTFTDILINDQLMPIATSGMKAQAGNEAGRTAGRTARAAAIGGLANGSSGARRGARVGLGASILTGGASINVPAGTIVEVSLSAALVVEQ